MDLLPLNGSTPANDARLLGKARAIGVRHGFDYTDDGAVTALPRNGAVIWNAFSAALWCGRAPSSSWRPSSGRCWQRLSPLAGDPLLFYAPAWPAGSAPLRELLEP